MTIAGKTVLVTGANRGIGQALVDRSPAPRREAGVRRHAPARWPTRTSGSRP